MSETMHQWVVDEIDEEVATCEVDGVVVMRVPRWLLPAEVRPGHVLRVRHRREGATSTLDIELDLSESKPLPLPDAPPPGTGDIAL